MSEKKTRSKAALAAVLLLLPPVTYAVWLLVLFLLDTLWGDGAILHQYYFESRGRLFFQLVSDSPGALPVFYAATALLWAVLHLLSRFRPRGGMLTAILAGALMGLIGAALLVDMSRGAAVPAVIAGSLMALVLHAARRSGSEAR